MRSRASALDRKSTRLNSSHQIISYAVFCLKNKKLDLEPEVSALNWRQPDIEGMGTFDVVFAADVLYERKNAADLASLLPKLFFFFFNDTATTEIYTLSLHDALPI